MENSLLTIWKLNKHRRNELFNDDFVTSKYDCWIDAREIVVDISIYRFASLY